MSETETLSTKVVKSTGWLFSFQILDNVLALVRLFIIARFLSPADFGLIGIATLTKQIIDTFTESGLASTIIYKKDHHHYLNVAWTFLLIRGVVLSLLVFILAPYIGIFFKSPTSVDVIRAVGSTFFIGAFTNAGALLFQKELQFKKVFIINIAGNFLDFVIAIVLAITLHNYWAVVAGLVANSILRLILSYVLSTYRPQLEFNFSKLKEMNKYGRWIFGSTLLQFLYSQGDDIIVGRMLGTTALGYYQFAYRVSNLPASQITHLISSVMFPTYSKVQNDVPRLRKIYLLTLQAVSFLSFFIGSMIIIFAHDFILLFLGTKWLPIELSLQMLSVWGIMRSVGALSGPVWQGTGRPHIITITQVIQVIVMVVIIFPLTSRLGIFGTSIAVVVAAIIPNIIVAYFLIKKLHIPIKAYVKEISIPLFGSLLMAATYWLFKKFIYPETNYLEFIVALTIVSIVYLVYTICMSKLKIYLLLNNMFSRMEHYNSLIKYTKYIKLAKKIML